MAQTNEHKVDSAIFAGGCFWCMQASFDLVPGVKSTKVGYTGGSAKDANYERVAQGDTGHYEAIKVDFDPAQVSYERILKEFWENIDPTQSDGQFADRGAQYTTAIFYASEAQRAAAERSLLELNRSGKFAKPVLTKILPAKPFYEAEDYHQFYYRKQPGHYKAYSVGSGRKGFIERVWGKKHDTKSE